MRPAAHLTLNLGMRPAQTFDLKLGDETCSTFDLELCDETRSTFDLELAIEGIDPSKGSVGPRPYAHPRGQLRPPLPPESPPRLALVPLWYAGS